MNKYRFAVIGYGGRGKHHTDGMEKSGSAGAECIAAVDVREPSSEEKQKFGDRFYSDYNEMLDRENPDFVIVASQEIQHVEHSLAALQRGIPVYLEKAVSHNWEGAVKLYREAVSKNYPLFVGYNLRRFPASMAAVPLIKEGKIGYVQSVLAHVNAGSDWSSNVFLRMFYRDASLCGDIVLSKLTHDTDFVQYALDTEASTCTGMITRNVWNANPQLLLSESSKIGIDSFSEAPSSHDVACATGLLKNGTFYTFLFTTTGPDYERRYIFNGTEGQIEFILHTDRPDVPFNSAVLWRYGEKPQTIDVPELSGGHGGADVQIHKEFFEWLDSNPKQPFDPESILRGMIIPIAAMESSQTGKHIDCAARLAEARVL